MSNTYESFGISFTYDDPTYATLILQAKNEDEAKELLAKMTEKMLNVKLLQIIPLKDAEVLNQFYVSQSQANKGTLQ